MFLRPRQKQFIDRGNVYCPRRGGDVELDVCAGCEHRVRMELREAPAYVVCRAPSPWQPAAAKRA